MPSPRNLPLLASLAALVAAASLLGCDASQKPAPPTADQPSTSAAATPTPPPTAAAPPATAAAAAPATAAATPPPQAAPGWETLAPLATPRAHHAAARLQDGRVLIHGGLTSSGPTGDAALFDPATRRWTEAAPSPAPYAHHALLPLPDGGAVAFGPAGGHRYDPKRDAWQPIAAPPQRIGPGCAAEIAADGRLVVTGGASGADLKSAPSRAVQIYDPRADAWEKPLALQRPRRGHTLTRLPDGALLIVGGFGANGEPERSTERLAPDLRTLQAAPRLPRPRADHSALLAPGGDLILLGGEGLHRYMVGEVEALRGDAWVEIGLLQPGSVGAFAAPLPQGRLLFAGGARGRLRRDPTNIAVAYDPAQNTWFDLPNMPERLSAGTATPLSSGQVLVVGGLREDGAPSPAAALLNP